MRFWRWRRGGGRGSGRTLDVQVLSNVACGDGYTNAATLGPVQNASYITGSLYPRTGYPGASAVYQIAGAGQPQQDWGPEQLLTPQAPFSIQNATGVRFRNAVAGQVAAVSCSLAQPGDPVFVGGQPLDGTIDADGTVVAPGLVTGTVLAYNSATADVAITTTASPGTSVVPLTSPVVALDGLTAIQFEAYIPAWFNNNNARELTLLMQESQVVLPGSAIYPLGTADTQGARTTDIAGSLMSWIHTPAAGSYRWALRAYASTGTNVTVRADDGSDTNYVPAFVRVTVA